LFCGGLISSLVLFPLPAEDGWSIEGWQPFAQRAELMPVATANSESESLLMASSGKPSCNGSWRKNFPVRPAQHYRITAEYLAEAVDSSRRSILAKIDWKDDAGKRVSQPDYPRLDPTSKGQWSQIRDIVQAPEGAASSTIDLIFRWDAAGQVTWRNVEFLPVQPPEARPVTLATVNFRPQNAKHPRENLERFGELVRRAAGRNAHFVLLPEGVTMVGTSNSYLEVAEPVPGPSTAYLGNLAQELQIYIVAGLLEQVGPAAYNTAVLIGPDGEVAGRYRKVSLPREEIEGGLTPGSEFPIFDTKFGRIGILICWDIQFPEGARRLAAKGAEIIFLPIWGGTEPLYPARSIENQVYLVTSSYDSTTGIWNRRGELIAEAAKEGEIAIATIDLARETHWEWLGNLRSRIPHESPLSLEEAPR
jgi:predicted amidohydrolase